MSLTEDSLPMDTARMPTSAEMNFPSLPTRPRLGGALRVETIMATEQLGQKQLDSERRSRIALIYEKGRI